MRLNHLMELAGMALQTGASDLFLAEDAPARLKIDGIMHEFSEHKVTSADLEEFWRACGADPAHALDMDAAWKMPGGPRFRVNLHRHLGRLGAVLRHIRTDIPDLATLGLPEELLISWLGRRSGLVLVTGPTGCGKSTTIAASLERINISRAAHIVTIEDPVEYVFQDKLSFFTQREVGLDTPTFEDGLRRAMRQAPDIIFVGEIRDAVTAMTALQASETGHLVFSTLHSPNIAETIDRLVNMVPPHQREGVLSLLSHQTVGIISQRLLPSVDSGRASLVCEYLEVEAAARDWLRAMDIPALTDFIRRGGNPHNRSYQDSLMEAVQEGRVSFETAIANSSNAAEFARGMRGVS